MESLAALTWPTSVEGWVTLIAGVVVILTALATWIPATRHLVVSPARRFLRSLPSRFPLRVVRKSTLDGLRAKASAAPPTPLPTAPKVLSLTERVEQLAHAIGDEVAKRDNLPFLARQRMGDSYRAYLPELRKLSDEIMKSQGYLPGELGQAAGMYDLNREQALEVREALLAIDWKQG